MAAPRWSPDVPLGLAAVSVQFPCGEFGWFLRPTEKWLILAEREGFTPLSMLMIYRALINCLNIGTHKKYQQSECTIASLAAADDKVSRLLRHNLAVFPHVKRRAVHARSLLRILSRTTQGTPDSSGKAQWSTRLRSRFRLHGLFSNIRGARPELSCRAQLSAKGR
jgi:hypothetical protein